MEKIFPKMNKENTAFIIIDVNNCWVHEKYEIKKWNITYKKNRQMAERLDDFIADWRDQVGSPIIFVKTTPWQKKFLPENINELYKDPDVCFYIKDKSSFASDFYLIKPSKKDRVFTKNTYDAFTNNQLLNHVKKEGIKYFIVAGVFADACVLFTVSGGFTKGYQFIILEDLIESRDQEQVLKKALLRNVYSRMFGKVMKAQDFAKQFK